MNNWYKYWNEVAAADQNVEYLKQVGHTIAGQPYTDQVFNELLAGIRRSLTLHPQDVLLDLCCGNGVITAQLAPYCKAVVGVDFSNPLIEIANHRHRPVNISYFNLDVMNLEKLLTPECGHFNKILMYGALQHFRRQDFKPILENAFKLSTPTSTIVIGGIPDIRRRNQFLDSFRKKAQFVTQKLLGRDRIGTWWHPVALKNTCSNLGLACEIDDKAHGRPGAHYRFDAIISRRA
jgi:2-polyprenyl-3-methyl-5-hydroxy-6-metoxy-1,4-benzoquinol methylase